MRVLLAIAIFAGALGSTVAISSNADAARRHAAKRHYYYPRYSRLEIECERARHFDPAGTYAGFPCWAREAFSQGNRGGGRR